MAIDVPGREDDLARLRAAYARLARTATTGETLYVTGAPGSGRTALLRAFADELAQLDAPPTLLAGAFENGRFVVVGRHRPAARAGHRRRREGRLAARGARPVRGARRPGDVARRGGARARAHACSIAAIASPRRSSSRCSCARCAPRAPSCCSSTTPTTRPAACGGTRCSSSPSTSRRDRPLLFVLAIERPAQLDGHEDDEPESLYLARRLRGRARARWVALDLVTIEELEEWTGPGGARGARAAGGRDGRARRVGGVPVAALARERDRGRGAREGEPGRAGRSPRAAASARSIRSTTCSARRLAGDVRRSMTRGAAAPARPRRARGPRLHRRRRRARPAARPRRRHRPARRRCCCATTSIPTASCTRPARSTSRRRTAATTTCGCTASARALDWLTLAHRGLDEPERREAARGLAQALIDVYGGPHYVAGTLARLYELAGDEEPARRYRRMADAGTDARCAPLARGGGAGAGRPAGPARPPPRRGDPARRGAPPGEQRSARGRPALRAGALPARAAARGSRRGAVPARRACSSSSARYDDARRPCSSRSPCTASSPTRRVRPMPAPRWR